MINLFDIVASEANTCESFKDRRLYQVWKKLQENHIKWKDIMPWNAELQWDKIGADQIEEIEHNDIKKWLTTARRIKSGTYGDRGRLVFCFKNEKLKYVFNPKNGELGVFDYNLSKNVDEFYWCGPDRRMHKRGQNDIYDALLYCDYLLTVYTDVNDSHQIKRDRADSKLGMTPDLNKADHNSHHLTKGVLGKNAGGLSDSKWDMAFYKWCEQTAQVARNKYKEIVSANKFKRDADTSAVDKAVENAMSLLMKFTTWATKNPDKISKYKLEEIMGKIYNKVRWVDGRYGRPGYYSSQDEILVCYQKYCANVMDLQSGDGYSLANSLKERDNLKKLILHKCNEFETLVNEYMAK